MSIQTSFHVVQPTLVLALRRTLTDPEVVPGDWTYQLANSHDQRLISCGALVVHVGDSEDVEVSDKEAADKEAADKEAADKEAADKEAADKEAADKEAAVALEDTHPVVIEGIESPAVVQVPDVQPSK